MAPILQKLPQQIGDYTITTLLSTQDDRDFYEAKQNHVERIVLLELIDAKKTRITTGFFVSSARARVSSQIPRVMPVYEAIQLEDYWYVAQERPKGTPLSHLLNEGQSLSIVSCCRLLEQVAELYHYCEENEISTTVLTAGSIYKDKGDSFHFLSPARSAHDNEMTKAEKMAHLADLIRPLVPEEAEGKTRITSLLQWLKEGFEGQLLPWSSIGSTASLIIEQLHPALLDHLNTRNNQQLLQQPLADKLKSNIYLQCVLAAIFTLCTAFVVLLVQDWRQSSENRTTLSINNTTINAQTEPVSVIEYASFLQKLKRMSPESLAELHKDLPPNAYEHTPAQWAEQLLLLSDKKTCTKPVHSVSYWDAIIYARLNQAQIPTIKQLKIIKKVTPSCDYSEWTSDSYDFPFYHRGYQAIDSKGKTQHHFSPADKLTKHSFRIIYTQP